MAEIQYKKEEVVHNNKIELRRKYEWGQRSYHSKLTRTKLIEISKTNEMNESTGMRKKEKKL